MELKSYGAETHQGPFLNINEDAYDFDFRNNMFMILDGFGGSGVGDKAVGELKENLKKFYTKIAADINSTMPFFYSHKYLIEGNALINSMIFSHKHLLAQNIQTEVAKRAGASIAIAVRADSLLVFASIGNCVVYLMRRGQLTKLFVEDSYNLLSGDKYDSHLKTMPISAFGLFADLSYQIKEVKVEPGDKYLMMTDGTYARLTEDEIKTILSQDDFEMKKKIQKFFKLSNSRGNLDNQTAMILEY